MEKVWELYQQATEIIKKLCQRKCSGREERCEDYIKDRLESNNFKTLKNYDPNHQKGATASTFLHIVVNSRLIDFVNSATERREKTYDPSIIDVDSQDARENIAQNTIETEILDEAIYSLNDKDKLYLKFCYEDELSPAEIADIVGGTAKNVSNHIGRVHAKLKKILEAKNYTLEDLL